MVYFSGTKRAEFSSPMRFEADVPDCEVLGTIPPELHGSFIRLGGDFVYPSRSAEDATANSDGYISMFRFADGRASYKGRYVRTPRYRANAAAGEQLFGVYRNPFTDDERVRGLDRTTANTAPNFHAGKLFACKEDSLPYEIDPETLDTIGPWDFHGKYKSQTFTAHPKKDPTTGEMITYGYEASGLLTDDLFIYVIDRSGEVTRETRIKVPYVSMVHDFWITQKHIIIPVWGYVTSWERLKSGKVHWGWDGTAPTYIGILPRDGDAKDMRWFKGPPGSATVHTVNARTEGDRVILEAPIFDGAPFPDFPPIDGSPWADHRGRAYFRRQIFDLNSKSDGWQEELLCEMPVTDLVRIDDRYASLPSRYAFTQYADPARPRSIRRGVVPRSGLRNCYGRFDLRDGSFDSYFAGPSHTLQECQFVPRSKDAPEGDGYLLGVASNVEEMRSELIIADTADLAAGDVARVILPFRAGAQIHGCWIPSATQD